MLSLQGSQCTVPRLNLISQRPLAKMGLLGAKSLLLKPGHSTVPRPHFTLEKLCVKYGAWNGAEAAACGSLARGGPPCAALRREMEERPGLEADGFTVDQEVVSSLEASIHKLLWSADSSAKTWETKSLNDPSGKDAGDTGDCAELSCKDTSLEHANARSMLKSSHNSLDICNRRRTHRRHKGCTIV